MMKVRLLNDGGFVGLKHLDFPMIIPSGYFEIIDHRFIKVSAIYLCGKGAVYDSDDIGEDDYYNFIHDEFEVIE